MSDNELKRLKRESLVPHKVDCITELGDGCEVLKVTEDFLPPTMLHEFIDLEIRGSCLVLLGSEDENFLYDLIELNEDQILHATLDPYNWFCVQNAKDCKIFYRKRFVQSENELPVVEEKDRENFSDDSSLTISGISLGIPSSNLQWTDSINAMVYWTQISKASEFWYHSHFIEWLEDLTSLKLSYPRHRPIWRRFQAGSYVIINENYPQESGLDVIYTLESTCSNSSIGNWVYVAEDGEVLLRVPCDKPNTLTLVYKTADENGKSSINRFRQYLSMTNSNEYAIQMIVTYPVKSEE